MRSYELHHNEDALELRQEHLPSPQSLLMGKRGLFAAQALHINHNLNYCLWGSGRSRTPTHKQILTEESPTVVGDPYVKIHLRFVSQTSQHFRTN